MFLPEGSLDFKAEKAQVSKAENSILELKRKARKSGDQSNGTGSSSPKKTKTDDAGTEPQKTQSDDSDAE